MLNQKQKNLKCYEGLRNCTNDISHIFYITVLEEHKNVNIPWLFPPFHLKLYSQSVQDFSHQIPSVTEDLGLRQTISKL